MSELPPPERRPEPFRQAPAQPQPSSLVVNTPGTMQPTRNIAHDMVGQNVGGRYRVKGVLGEGGMGTVYDAAHLGLGRDVAIKVLNPSQAKKRVAVKRFQQEARAAGAIGHPNICEVYDMGLLDDGSPYLVMEKLVGQTLADRINREGGLPFDELVEIMVQVLSGLIAAHDKGIVHRDIKPENIFLARRAGVPPIVKILDFGVSKMMPAFLNGEEQLDLTRTGMVMGTPYYMSPEQARGERNLDGRVDVYATGVMMYEAIAGKRPFLAPNYNALLLAIINTTPTPLTEVRPATPRALQMIVARAMAKNRGERYPSAGHLLRDLQSMPVAKHETGPRLPPPPTREERMRAPILGGHEVPRSTRGAPPPPPSRLPSARASEPSSRSDGPGAKLQRRMNEGGGGEPSTRLDIRVKGQPQSDSPIEISTDSIEISVDFTGSDTPVLPIRHEGPPPGVLPSLPEIEEVDEAPTEIFRPNKAKKKQSAPPPREPSSEDWENETVVRPQSLPLPIPGKRRSKLSDPTVKVDLRAPPKSERAPESVEIDFSDETKLMPQGRRPR